MPEPYRVGARAGWLDELVGAARSQGPTALENYALQNRSIEARDLIALAASGGRMTCDEVLARVHDRPAGSARDAVDLEPGAVLSLARLVANQGRSREEIARSVDLFDLVLDCHGPELLRPDDRLILFEALAQRATQEALRRRVVELPVPKVGPAHFSLLEANTLNPAAGHAEGPEQWEAWLSEVNRAFLADGLEPVALAPGRAPVFDRLLCGPGTLVVEGPLVTVVVPTRNPGPRLGTAMRSILGQSYRRLEVLVMDDCSSPSEAHRIKRWEQRDARVRVVRLDENGGTYRARNKALTSHAEGELFTVHDDDDWSHPRKIERQVEHLLSHPQELANVSQQTRATPELLFARINSNPRLVQPNYSSLMFWRKPLVEELGFWDELNRAADAELFNRIIAHTGRRTSVVGKSPLSLLRIRAGSLTSGELARGYLDVRRRWYESAYRTWHSTGAESGSSLRLAAGELPRRFAAPTVMLARPVPSSESPIDITFATDFRMVGWRSELTAQIEKLVQDGRRVGLLQMDSPWERGGEPWEGGRALVSPGMLELSQRDAVEVTSLDEARTTSLVVVPDPRVLLLAPRRLPRWTVGRVVLVSDGDDQLMEDARERVPEVFGQVPVNVTTGLADGVPSGGWN